MKKAIVLCIGLLISVGCYSQETMTAKQQVKNYIHDLRCGDTDVRISAAYALGDMKALEAIPALAEKLDTIKDEYTGSLILFSLASMEDKRVMPYLLTVLNKEDKKPYDLYEPYFIFCRYGTDSTPSLLEVLKNGSRTAKLKTLNVLAFLMDERAISPVIRMLDTESDTQVRIAAYSVLMQMNYDTRAQGTLEKAAVLEKNQTTKKYALTFVGTRDEKLKLLEKEKKKAANNLKLVNFKYIYDILMENNGKEEMSIDTRTGEIVKGPGYRELKLLAKKKDLQDLERLRKKMMCRLSDECLYDYQEVSTIIWKIRWEELNK